MLAIALPSALAAALTTVPSRPSCDGSDVHDRRSTAPDTARCTQPTCRAWVPRGGEPSGCGRAAGMWGARRRRVHARARMWPPLALGAAILAFIGVVRRRPRAPRAARMLLAQSVAAARVVTVDAWSARRPIRSRAARSRWAPRPSRYTFSLGDRRHQCAQPDRRRLDGLAAGVGLIVAGTLCLISLSVGRADIAVLTGTLAGALVGFPLFQLQTRRPSSLGDSGSLFLATRSPFCRSSRRTRAPRPCSCWRRSWRSAAHHGHHAHGVRRILVSHSLMQPTATTSIPADRARCRSRRAVLVLYVACLVLNWRGLQRPCGRPATRRLCRGGDRARDFLGVRKLRYHELPVRGFAMWGRTRSCAGRRRLSRVAYAVAVMALHGACSPPRASSASRGHGSGRARAVGAPLERRLSRRSVRRAGAEHARFLAGARRGRRQRRALRDAGRDHITTSRPSRST